MTFSDRDIKDSNSFKDVHASLSCDEREAVESFSDLVSGNKEFMLELFDLTYRLFPDCKDKSDVVGKAVYEMVGVYRDAKAKLSCNDDSGGR